MKFIAAKYTQLQAEVDALKAELALALEARDAAHEREKALRADVVTLLNANDRLQKLAKPTNPYRNRDSD